jgi:hypothetical protein
MGDPASTFCCAACLAAVLVLVKWPANPKPLLSLVEKEKVMKMVRGALIAILIIGLTPGALLLPAAASHPLKEGLPNGVVYEPISPDPDGGLRTKFS